MSKDVASSADDVADIEGHIAAGFPQTHSPGYTGGALTTGRCRTETVKA